MPPSASRRRRAPGDPRPPWCDRPARGIGHDVHDGPARVAFDRRRGSSADRRTPRAMARALRTGSVPGLLNGRRPPATPREASGPHRCVHDVQSGALANPARSPIRRARQSGALANPARSPIRRARRDMGPHSSPRRGPALVRSSAVRSPHSAATGTRVRPRVGGGVAAADVTALAGARGARGRVSLRPRGPVAQWQSEGLLIPASWVRIPAGSRPSSRALLCSLPLTSRSPARLAGVPASASTTCQNRPWCDKDGQGPRR